MLSFSPAALTRLCRQSQDGEADHALSRAAQIFGLLFLYMLLLSSVQLAFTVMKAARPALPSPC